MPNIKSRGLIIRQHEFGEANRMLTVFCEDIGIVKVSAYGARNTKGRQAAALQVLTYSDFVFYKGTSDILSINAAETVDSFFSIRESIEKLSLCTYLSEITYTALDQHVPDNQLLHLFLNTLYLLAYKDISCKLAKTVYEIRLAAHSGYMPILNRCKICGREDGLAFFSYAGGALCGNCAAPSEQAVPISADCLHAFYYILAADEKKVFSFRISEELLSELSVLSETYIQKQLDRSFQSLEYYKNIIS